MFCSGVCQACQVKISLFGLQIVLWDPIIALHHIWSLGKQTWKTWVDGPWQPVSEVCPSSQPVMGDHYTLTSKSLPCLPSSPTALYIHICLEPTACWTYFSLSFGGRWLALGNLLDLLETLLYTIHLFCVCLVHRKKLSVIKLTTAAVEWVIPQPKPKTGKVSLSPTPIWHHYWLQLAARSHLEERCFCDQ